MRRKKGQWLGTAVVCQLTRREGTGSAIPYCGSSRSPPYPSHGPAFPHFLCLTDTGRHKGHPLGVNDQSGTLAMGEGRPGRSPLRGQTPPGERSPRAARPGTRGKATLPCRAPGGTGRQRLLKPFPKSGKNQQLS